MVFENTQYPYAFISQINQQFKIMRLDNDFNANFSMLSFSHNNINNIPRDFKLKISNNTIYLWSTINTKFDINTFRLQSYTIPLNMSLNSENWVYSNLNEYNESYYRIKSCPVLLCLVPLWNWKNLGLWKYFQQNFFLTMPSNFLWTRSSYSLGFPI